MTAAEEATITLDFIWLATSMNVMPGRKEL